MKNLLLAALLLTPIASNASPYFRPLDPSHLAPVGGALLDPRDLGNSEAAGLLPLLTHSPKDGCLIPGVCEDWTPLAVGGSMNAGKLTFNVAPLANVLPWVYAAGHATTPQRWLAVYEKLAPADSTITFSAGPVWQYRQATNKGYLKIFTGLALHF